MTTNRKELEREFELERLILFSDAVFAIAITLLIIEIKFPEIHPHSSAEEIYKAFKPTLIQFLAFILSFFFIGTSWGRHLRICRLMSGYDMGVIRRNLIFLFFIVCFPFTASGITEHVRPGFFFPLYLYVGNIACVGFAHMSLCNYIFFKKPHLSVYGHEREKKYMFLLSRYSAIALAATCVLAIILPLIFGEEKFPYVVLSFNVLPLIMLYAKKRLKKYKPFEEE